MKPVREQTPDELAYNLKDLNEVIAIQEVDVRKLELPPDQVANVFPKLGQYHDERHEVLGEMRRRVSPPAPRARRPPTRTHEGESLILTALAEQEAQPPLPPRPPISDADVERLVLVLRGAPLAPEV